MAPYDRTRPTRDVGSVLFKWAASFKSFPGKFPVRGVVVLSSCLPSGFCAEFSGDPDVQPNTDREPALERRVAYRAGLHRSYSLELRPPWGEGRGKSIAPSPRSCEPVDQPWNRIQPRHTSSNRTSGQLIRSKSVAHSWPSFLRCPAAHIQLGFVVNKSVPHERIQPSDDPAEARVRQTRGPARDRPI
jgi:hypothetical protein